MSDVRGEEETSGHQRQDCVDKRQNVGGTNQIAGIQKCMGVVSRGSSRDCNARIR